MKLTAKEARDYFRKPRSEKAAILIYGPDAMLVAHAREATLKALTDGDDRADLRIDRIQGKDLGRNPHALEVAAKSQGFFAPEGRLIRIDEVGDASVEALRNAIDGHAPGDPFLVVTAGNLRASSKLRKLFESHGNALSAPVYSASLAPSEMRRMASDAGLNDLSEEAVQELLERGEELPPVVLEQLLRNLALFKMDDSGPVSRDDVRAVAPETVDGSIENLIEQVAERQVEGICRAFRSLSGRNQNAVPILIHANRVFRTILQVASDPSGPNQGIARLKPPVFGKKRDNLVRQARVWGVAGSEAALQEILETDRLVRSGARVPQLATVERVLLRIAKKRVN